MEKHYQSNQVEPAMQALWEQEQIYKFDPQAPGELYSIDTPPPTVSGSLHIGHIFSYTQAEMVARFRRMQGCNVFYPFGFDDNGLPTERLVERELGIRAKDLPRSAFVRQCQALSADYEAQFQALWQSLGFCVDWSLQYRTVSEETQRISQRSFLDLVRKGKAYLKESPVLWCTECGTSIAQAELESQEADSQFHYIPFTVGGDVLPVATTRPELLYGCVCLFVHPEDARYRKYAGQHARVPLYDYEIPIFTDASVSPEQGTGVVMCATFGDSTDALWYETHSLPYRRVITPEGFIAQEVPFLGGMTVSQAREAVTALLGERGLLLRSEPLRHAVAVHERCGRAVEILPSRQWYIDILREKERFLRAAEDIRWYPASMKNRYTVWVENLKWDWCISRQRYFGVPFPVWYCKACGAPVFAKESQTPINPVETPYHGSCACGCTEFLPETAVLDTWATSSLTPQINARAGEAADWSDRLLPMSMRTQAHEIIRTWAFYTIVKSLYHRNELPWEEIMICGFVLAKPGEKISKSKSNAEAGPSALLARHSADALRYWAATARLGTDTYFSEADMALSRRFLTKLWNASRFALSQLEDFRPEAAPPSTDICGTSGAPSPTPALPPVDRWILARLDEVTRTAAALLYDYEIGLARQEIDTFFWRDFCDNYIELVKERLYSPELHGETVRRAGQYTLFHTLLGLLKLYAIYVPHITEYLYQNGFREAIGVVSEEPGQTVSLHSLTWAKPAPPEERLLRFGDSLREAVAQARRYKSERNLSLRAEMDVLEVRTAEDLLPLLEESREDLMACTRAREMRLVPL